MGGSTTRKSYTKIKNFTEKDQVRIKYSHIGKDKKLMLSVYIGEEVYNELTNGQNFKRLQVKYIPNDMVIITPTNNEKEGIIHRYNGKGLFKTTCVRLNLSTYKKLKIRKKDFNNRVVDYLFASRSDGKCLNVDLIGDKRKSKFIHDIHDNAIREIINLHDVVPQDYVSKSKIKPLEINAPKEDIDDTHMFVSHDFLNDVRDAIENRLLNMEERFEKRIQLLESLLKEFMEQPLPPLKADKGNGLDIDILKKISNNITDVMNFKLSKIESEINELIIKNIDLNSRLNLLLQKLEDQTIDPEYMSFRFSEIKELLNEIKKSHENKSLMEKIFGKD